MNDPHLSMDVPQPSGDDVGTLIVAYLDDRLDDAGAQRLSEILVADAEARRLYVATCMQARVIASRLGPELEAKAAPRMADHDESMTILREVLELEEQAHLRRQEALAEQRAQEEAEAIERRKSLSVLLGQVESVPPVRHYVIPRWAVYGAAAAVAAMLLMLVLPWLSPADTPAPTPAPQPIVRNVEPAPDVLAQLNDSFDLRWAADSALPTNTGDLVAGEYHLERGCVRLEMVGGGDIIVQAPARFRIDSDQQVTLWSGRLVGHCPTLGRELIVQTPGATVVDIGTEFGVLVDQHGASQVHVFDGIVEITPSSRAANSTPQRITRGQARHIDESGEHIAPIEHHELAFMRGDEFRANVEANRGSAYHRWVRYQYELRRDPTLVVYYAMDPAHMQGDTLLNLGSAGDVANATVVAAQWQPGRFDNAQTLAFIDDQMMLSADIPGNPNQVTIATWVKLNKISYPHSGIIMSEDWLGDTPGYVHFGVKFDGLIEMSVTGVDQYALPIRSDTALVTPEHLGRWVHLVVVYDNERNLFRIYRNGEKVMEQRIDAHYAAAFGRVQIGNWTANALGWPEANRVLNGCMDELCIFYRAVTDDEVKRMYEAGVPDK